MSHIKGGYRDRRGAIESRAAFVVRNLRWWLERPRVAEEAKRWPVYERFLESCSFPYEEARHWFVGEVGAGPYGGMRRRLKTKAKCYIDYIQEELCELGFIEWPQEDWYVTAPAEAIPLSNHQLDALVSFNCLDHGWGIERALAECVRVARRCYLSFDCRGDSPEQVAQRRGQDQDHWQLLRYDDVGEIVARVAGERPWSMCDLKTNTHFPVVGLVICSDPM